MYVSINWLKTILNFNTIKLNSFEEKLTLSGFEVEETNIFKILDKNDIILNLAITTNRSDLLSIVGLTQEIKSLLNFQIKQFKIKEKYIDFFKNFKSKKISHNDFPGTSSFILSEFKNINIKNIQPWIKRRLIANNINLQNNLNDLAQYSLLEWGQPIYLYDFDKLKKLTKTNRPQISIRFAKLGELFIESESRQYFLTEETLIITAENIPISIAGSIISKDCSVDNYTKNLIIQASIFDSKVFRRSERSVGLRTEYSVFLEKGINKFLIKASYNRFLNLINLFNNTNDNGLNNFQFYFTYSKLLVPLKNEINISFENIKKILGFNNGNYDKQLNEKIFNYFNQSKFKFTHKNNSWSILIPLTRVADLEEEIDLIEEISRFYGFNNFVSILPISKKIGKLSKHEILKREFRNNLLNLGFTEIYNYSLISENLNNPTIINPLITDYSSLRSNFLPQLLKTLEKNISQGNKIRPIFEIGRSFEKNPFNNSFFEFELICGIFGSNNYRISWLEKESKLNWFQAVYFLEIIFKNLGLEIYFLRNSFSSTYYHPKNCLSILYKNQEIGFFGEINTKLFSTDTISKNYFLFQIYFTKILSIKANKTSFYFKPYSYYPSLSLDLSLLVPLKITFQEILLIIKDYGKELIEEIELFDIYEKFESIDKYYSLGLKIIFRSKQKTLLKNEIDLILFEIINKLKQNLNINIRV
jgi:phenylalanyl-tRNA synthetase beta chain